MNLLKSIQHMVLASLVMTTVVPSIMIAAPRNASLNQTRDRRPEQRRVQPRLKTAANKKQIKNAPISFWTRFKNNWEYAALGGCALIGIIAAILMFNKKSAANNNLAPVNPVAPRPTVLPQPNPGINPSPIKIDPKDPDLIIKDGDCAICFEQTKDRTPCCQQPVCRQCWNTPVKGGDAEFVDDNLGLRIVDQGKVLKAECPLCRKDKRRMA